MVILKKKKANDTISENIRFGDDLKNLRVEIKTLLSAFQEAGAVELDIPSLIDSNVLIDLYGEDLRSRAFTTSDPVNGEKILRPDFTVPIAEMHIASKKNVAKYSYSGPVWRSQPYGSKKPIEYYQVGFEYFHEIDSALADAEVFALFWRSLRNFDLEIEIGDMSILRAIVSGLDISPTKKMLLLRHLWRPNRFRELIQQLSEENSSTDTRNAIFDSLKKDQIRDYLETIGPVIGIRTIDEIEIRAKELLEEESSKPISQNTVKMLEKIQSLRCPMSDITIELSKFISLDSDLEKVCQNIDYRTDSMHKLGINAKNLNFVTSLRRASLEYYDGFVFSMALKDRPEFPPVSQGGRYDALTAVLGKDATIPAVGGIIRPEILTSVRLEV